MDWWSMKCRPMRWRSGGRWPRRAIARSSARWCPPRRSPRSSGCATPTAQPTNRTDMASGRAKAIAAIAWRIEDGLTAGALALMALLPAIEPVLRKLFGVGIPGTSGYVQNLTLWVAYLGAMVASREGRHLDLSTGMFALSPRVKPAAKQFVAFLSTAVATGLFWASFQFVRSESAEPLRIG